MYAFQRALVVLFDEIEVERVDVAYVGQGKGEKHCLWLFQVVVGRPLGGRQEDMTVPFHPEKSDAAAHLLEAPVGFAPLDLLTEHPGEARAVRSLFDEVVG